MSGKAIILTGGKQYLVSKGDILEVELINSDKSKIEIEPLMIVDGSKSKIGNPNVKGSKVTLEILEQVKSDKTTAIRYKAKKRIHKTKGHRQSLSKAKVLSIV